MAEVASCPKCSCPLSLPAELPPDARLRCPGCDEEFGPADVKPAKLAQAVLVEAPPEPPISEPLSAERSAEKKEIEQLAMPSLSLFEAKEPEQPISEAGTLDEEKPEEATLKRAVAEGLADLLERSPDVEPKLAAPRLEPTEQPSERSSEKPLGTLSDWMRRSPEVESPEADAASKEPSKATEQPTAKEAKPAGSKTLADSPFTTQPSLESLLSSLRGGEPAEAASEPRTGMPSRPLDPVKPRDANLDNRTSPAQAQATAPGAQERPSSGAVPSPGEREKKEPRLAGDLPAKQPAPSGGKFEDLPVEALTAQAATEDRAPRQPTPRNAAAAPVATSPQTSGSRSAPLMPGARPENTKRAEGRDKARPNERAGRRSRAWRRTRTGSVVVVSGAVGLLLGYAGLVWLAGPSSDILGVARLMPSGVLPDSFRVAEPTTGPAPAAGSEGEDSSRQRHDPMVAPAAFTSLTEQSKSRGVSVADPDPLDAPSPLAVASRSGGGVRLIGAPSPYSLSQLTDVLQGAEAARRTMSEKGLASTPKAARELGSAYGKLCQVAQVLTFVEDDPADRDMTRLEAKELFIRLFTYGHARTDSCAMASRWLAWPQRTNGGVFFAGRLVSAEKKGEVYEFRLKLAENDFVSVLVEDIDVGRFINAKEIGVVGCVVEEPAERIVGYSGDAPRAVWAGHTISLGAPRHD